MQCKICNKKIPLAKLGIHSFNKHRVKAFDYAIMYLNCNINPPLCKCGCGNNVGKWGGLENQWPSYCQGHNPQNYTEATRLKISNSLKEGILAGRIIPSNLGMTKENSESIRIRSLKISKALNGKALSKEHKKQIADTLKRKYKDGLSVWNEGLTKEDNLSLKRASEKLTGVAIPDKIKSKISNTVKEIHKNGDSYGCSWKKKLSDAMKKMAKQGRHPMQTLKMRKMQSNLLKQKNLNGMMSYNRKMTNPEKVIKTWFDDLIYCGNGAYWVNDEHGSKNPDFYVKGDKLKVVEVFGDYWHKKWEEKWLVALYKRFGIRCLIIWESQIYNHSEYVKKCVKRFIES